MDLPPKTPRVSASKRVGTNRRLVSAEAEYEFLKIAIFCLLGLIATLSLMTRFPELGALIASYNQF
jgi:hypothetical protein